VTRRPALLAGDFVLAEEAGGVGVDETADIADLIHSLHDDRMTFLVVEHDMEFVRKISEQVTVLNQGSVLRQGPIEEIENDDEVRQIYLGENA
jgi:amino acid/amide ABC transporter ATP-binding protein 1, HAAT family (TC 3.A.1.4.-)